MTRLINFLQDIVKENFKEFKGIELTNKLKNKIKIVKKEIDNPFYIVSYDIINKVIPDQIIKDVIIKLNNDKEIEKYFIEESMYFIKEQNLNKIINEFENMIVNDKEYKDKDIDHTNIRICIIKIKESIYITSKTVKICLD